MKEKVSGVRCPASAEASAGRQVSGKSRDFLRSLKADSYQLPAGSRGFTLVEMIVAVALFAIVMLISTGALLALVGANRKAQALQSVMNNLNMALDGMIRSIRMGHLYRCGSSNPADPNCSSGGDIFYFESFEGTPAIGDDWAYAFDTTGVLCGINRLCKSEDNGGTFYPLTAPEITIDAMDFRVIGATRGDLDQPKVVITLKGTAGARSVRTQTTFSIQATAVQRTLDL